jgi:hypothetical protein
MDHKPEHSQALHRGGYVWGVDAALYTDKILKRSTLEQMWNLVKLNNGTHTAYNGLGWFVEAVNAPTRWWRIMFRRWDKDTLRP